MYNMALHDQGNNSFSGLIPAAEAAHAMIPRLEEFRVGRDQLCSLPDCYYSEKELEAADALTLLSLSRSGVCVSSSSSAAADSMSHIISRDIESNATETPPVTSRENNHLLLRIKLGPMAKRSAYKCDTCGREFWSSQALGGHKTSHRPKPTTVIPDLNLTPRVFECSICSEVYNSGRALGGHKRKHHSLQ